METTIPFVNIENAQKIEGNLLNSHVSIFKIWRKFKKYEITITTSNVFHKHVHYYVGHAKATKRIGTDT